MFIKRLSVIILLCLMASSSVEGRIHSSSRHQISVMTQKIQAKHLSQQRRKQVVAQSRPRRVLAVKPSPKQEALTAKQRPRRTVVVKKAPSQPIARARSLPKQITAQRKKAQQAKPISLKRVRDTLPSTKSQIQQKASVPQKRHPSPSTLKKSSRQQPLPVKRAPANRNVLQNKTNHLSLLPFHTKCNAQAGGLDKLWNKDMKGQGQTVAVIELSGEWQRIKDIANGKYGAPPPAMKASYKSNFLTPIGGPGLHPEEQNDWLRNREGSPHHGSSVSSVILDLAPQAKILPVSTYNTYGSRKFYDTADALMNLSRRPEVSIINLSSGHTNFDVTTRSARKEDGTEHYLVKCIYPLKLTQAFKAVAKAGKVVVIAAGNEGKPIDVPAYAPSGQRGTQELIGHLMQELDPETRQSIIVTGSCEPDTRKAKQYSNKPGSRKNIQDAFLLAPGGHLHSYDNNDLSEGTSFAAPYICAAIANLTSKSRNITPKRAVQALKETAEKRPDIATYGRGIIRADKALEWLERSY